MKHNDHNLVNSVTKQLNTVFGQFTDKQLVINQFASWSTLELDGLQTNQLMEMLDVKLGLDN